MQVLSAKLPHVAFMGSTPSAANGLLATCLPGRAQISGVTAKLLSLSYLSQQPGGLQAVNE